MAQASTIRNTTVLALSVFALAAASVSLTRFDGGAAFLWPATAVPLAILTTRQPRDWLWPIVATMAGEFVASSLFGLGVVSGIPLAIAVAAEAVIAALILRAAGNDLSSFDSLPSLAIFIAAAGIVAPAISGLIAAEVITHHLGQSFWPNWRAWFAAHSLGTVSVAPLLLLVLRADGFRRMRSAPLWHKLEAAGLLLSVAATSVVVFEQQRYPLLFLPMLPLILTTFRLGRLGAAASILILAATGGTLTLMGSGPINLIDVSFGERAQFFQFYLTIAVFTVLPVAAELRRREALAIRTSESEATYRLLAEQLGDTLVHTSLSGKVRYASPAIADLTGFGPGEVQGHRSREFVLAEDFDSHARAREAAIANPGQTVSVEYRVRRKDDAVITCETRMRSYTDAHGTPVGLILVIRDVTERRAAEARLAVKAATDELTGLPNRRAFFDRLSYLQREVASGQCIGCIAIFDIDFFKAVNDTHGHSTGDLVLALIAQAAKAAVRSGDMIARVGGEEFAIVLWGASVPIATQTCERIRSAIEAYRIPLADGRTIGVTASFGAAEIRAGTPVETTYDAADQALYAAKASGRNRLRIAA